MARFTETDRQCMSRAIRLAWSAKGRTFPNPAVGAVVAAGGTIVGQGSTKPAGMPHAERVALARAGARAKGATLYVTLEPCCHHGRTPPCTDAIIAAGIREVVAAAGDPNPLVNGKGFAALRRAGVTVRVGPLAEDAARINEDFFHAITARRAFITLKLALTLDGRSADESGGSRWITDPQARVFGHELRRQHAAVAVGMGTLAADDPKLTVRHKKGFHPARIVFASDTAIPHASYFVRQARQARTIAVIPGKNGQRIETDTRTGMEFWFTGRKETRQHLRAFTRMAFENGLTSVLVEGGRTLASAFLEHRLVNRLYLLYGNKLLGGGMEGFRFGKGLRIGACISLKNPGILLFPNTFGITGIPVLRS